MLLQKLLFFIVAISILVAIHEFGHFWVARKLGVKVLRFSIGFGKPLWQKISPVDGTEYQIAAIPLGGYVKMADEREGNVAAEDLPHAFNRQSVWKRIAIVAAGPIANFIFAVFAFSAMYLIGIDGLKPVIGQVAKDSIAMQVGFQEQDEITSVNGQSVVSWETAGIAIIEQALETGVVEVGTRSASGQEQSLQVDLSDSRNVLGDQNVLQYLGIEPWRPVFEATLGEIVPNGAAATAGLVSGDRIVSIDGVAIDRWRTLVDVVVARPNQTVDVEFERNGQNNVYSVVLGSASAAGKSVGRIGAGPKVDEKAYKEAIAPMLVKEKFGLFSAIKNGANNTWRYTMLTLRFMGKLLTGQASTKNISGPLTIAEFAGESAAVGLSTFLSFLALISLSLGIINLLPIPVLDGGHLFFYMIEIVKGSPVSAAVEAVGQRLGLAMLGGLMFLAFYNDITRIVFR